MAGLRKWQKKKEYVIVSIFRAFHSEPHYLFVMKLA